MLSSCVLLQQLSYYIVVFAPAAYFPSPCTSKGNNHSSLYQHSSKLTSGHPLQIAHHAADVFTHAALHAVASHHSLLHYKMAINGHGKEEKKVGKIGEKRELKESWQLRCEKKRE